MARQIHLFVSLSLKHVEIPPVDGRNPASQLLGSFVQLCTIFFPNKKQDRNSNHQKSKKQRKPFGENGIKSSSSLSCDQHFAVSTCV